MKALARREEVAPSARAALRERARVTLGELVSAAFDAAGSDVSDVKRLLASRPMRRALKARVVFV